MEGDRHIASECLYGLVCRNQRGAGNHNERNERSFLDLNHTLEDMNTFYHHLVPALKEVDNTVSLQIANAVWIEETFPVKTPLFSLCNITTMHR